MQNGNKLDETGKKSAVQSISDAEWQVAKVLWQSSPLTAAEIIDSLKDSTGWNPKTIHTLINRLAKKGIIKALPNIRPYTYRPLITESECVREKTRSLVDRFYNGSFHLLVARFIKDEKLTEKEIEELKNILDQQKGG